jgi:hypothetical protein
MSKVFGPFTIAPWGFPIDVTADVEAPEQATYTDPGCGWSIAVIRACVGGIDIYEMLNNAQLERIEEAIERVLEA